MTLWRWIVERKGGGDYLSPLEIFLSFAAGLLVAGVLS